MQLTLEQKYMLSILLSQYHSCWCSGDFRGQCISRHGIDPQSRNMPSPASEELRTGREIPIAMITKFRPPWDHQCPYSCKPDGRLNIKMWSFQYIKMSSCQYSIPILKIRWSLDRLIFDMVIPIPGKTVFILRWVFISNGSPGPYIPDSDISPCNDLWRWIGPSSGAPSWSGVWVSRLRAPRHHRSGMLG